MALVICTKPTAGIIQVAAEAGIPTAIIQATGQDFILELVRLQEAYNTKVLVLAGFMRLLSPQIVAAYCGNVLNIHPALLPKYGGKGMYGIHVHTAVLEAGEEKSGATVHLVSEEYDEGAILEQQEYLIPPNTTPEQLQASIKALEHKLYPKALHNYIMSQIA